MADKLRHAAVHLNQIVRKFHRMRCGETDAVNTVNRGDILNQQRQIGSIAVEHRAAISVHILAEQIDFAHSLGGERGTFGNHIIKRAAHLLAARIRHNAERAILRAAFHHRDKRRRPFRAWLRQMVELLDFRKRYINHPAPLLLRLADQVRQTVQRLRPKDHIHRRRAAAQLLTLLRGNTTANRDDDMRLGVFQRLPATNLRKDLLLRLLADRTSIEQKNIGLFRRRDRRNPVRHLEHGKHLGRVVLVHLAAVSFNIDVFQ